MDKEKFLLKIKLERQEILIDCISSIVQHQSFEDQTACMIGSLIKAYNSRECVVAEKWRARLDELFPEPVETFTTYGEVFSRDRKA